MAEVVAQKDINAGQLGVELGRIALRVTGPVGENTYIIRTQAIGQAVLQNGVDAHIADPDWVDPAPPPPGEADVRAQEGETAKTELEKVRAWAKRAYSDPALNPLTPNQQTKLLAALVLRITKDG